MTSLPASDKKRTIIFDLDETLIHTVDDPFSGERCDFKVNMHFTGETDPILAGVNIRPYVEECLRAAN